jgi:hypothetical protein
MAKILTIRRHIRTGSANRAATRRTVMITAMAIVGTGVSFAASVWATRQIAAQDAAKAAA